MRTLVIAEAGSTHDGNRAKMSELIRVAAAAGADACKFQFCSSPERLAMRRHAEEYLWAYRLIAFPREWLPELKAECDAAGIEFMCTVFLPEDIAEIAPLVARFKVASYEAGDAEFLAAHDPYLREDEWIVEHAGKTSIRPEDGYDSSCQWRVPKRDYDEIKHGHIRGAFTIRRELIVSTGMGDDALVDELIFQSNATAILHCVSAYPCPIHQVNVAAIGAIKRRIKKAERDERRRIRETNSFAGATGYDIRVGFSDHTGHVLAGMLAAAHGARIIEVHFRLPSTVPSNPDYGHSLDPARLTEYIANIRLAETAMGDGVKRMMPSEERWAQYRVRA